MEFKLAYKSYPFSISLGSCKRFTDSTGLDLHSVLMDYLHAFTSITRKPKVKTLELLCHMSKVYSREVACKLFYAITDKSKEIPLEEFQDGTLVPERHARMVFLFVESTILVHLLDRDREAHPI